MDLDSKKVFKTLNPNKIWIPIGIGLVIVFYLFYSDPDLTTDKLKLIFDASIGSVLLALLVIIIRDGGYVYRIRTLTGKQLTWKPQRRAWELPSIRLAFQCQQPISPP